MNMRLDILWIFIAVCCLSCTSGIEPQAYMSQVQSKDYIGSLVLNGTDRHHRLIYKSKTFMMLNHMDKDEWSQKRFDELRSDFQDLYYFEFMPELDLHQPVSVSNETFFYKRDKLVESQIGMKSNGETIEPVIFQVERYYGLKPDKYLMAFDRNDIDPDNLIFTYNTDEGLASIPLDPKIFLEPTINW